MKRGRRPAGAKLVEDLSGSAEAKKKVKVILETLAGGRSIEEACRELRIGEAAFHKMRTKALEKFVRDCEPERPGRNPIPKEEGGKVEELEAEVKRLERELLASRVREELAVALPHVGKRMKDRKKTEP